MEGLGDLVARYGYTVIALLVFVESVGVPLPGDTALVTAAALAARGRLSFGGVIAAAAAGAILGGTAGYWIGARTGTALVLHHGRWLGMDRSRVDRAERYFARYGAAAIFFGRFVAFLRTLVVVLAGVARVPFGRFTLINVAASVAWSASLGAVGYLFGRNLPRLVKDLGRASLLAAIFVALVVAAVLAWRWFYRNRGTLVGPIASRWARAMESPRLRALGERYPTAWRYVAARFARGEYLALHLVLGFLVSLGMLGIFSAITEDVVEGAPLTHFDVTLATRLHASLTPLSLAVLNAVSYLGSPPAMAGLLVIVALGLAVRRRWLTLAAWVAAYVGVDALDLALKFIIHRTRLPFAAQYLHGQTFSFPSGHAMGALIGYGMLAHMLALEAHRASTRAGVVTLAAVLVVAIGVGRLYLGVHYFSDVTAGLAAGILWLTTCVTGLELAKRHHGPPVGDLRRLAA